MERSIHFRRKGFKDLFYKNCINVFKIALENRFLICYSRSMGSNTNEDNTAPFKRENNKSEFARAKHLPEDCIIAIKKYHLLEEKVRQSITHICTPFCSQCIDGCCQEQYCRESVDSFWLKLIWKMNGCDISGYDSEMGWLRSDGCLLSVGRPPVCYEYFCNNILNMIEKEPYERPLREISKIISLAGRNALGNRHLVTLSDEQILRSLNFKRLINKISDCFKLYEQLEPSLGDG